MSSYVVVYGCCLKKYPNADGEEELGICGESIAKVRAGFEYALREPNSFLILPTGRICVSKEEDPRNGAKFSHDALRRIGATFPWIVTTDSVEGTNTFRETIVAMREVEKLGYILGAKDIAVASTGFHTFRIRLIWWLLYGLWPRVCSTGMLPTCHTNWQWKEPLRLVKTVLQAGGFRLGLKFLYNW